MPPETLVLISGSCKFMSQMSEALAGKSKLVIALDKGNRVSNAICTQFPEVVWKCIAHGDVGGVTLTMNWIGLSEGLELGTLQGVPYCCSVGDVFKPTLRG